MIIEWENVRTSGAHVRKTCARPRKCARRAPSAPLISNTVWLYTRGVHGQAAGCTLYEPVRPDGAQNKTLISNTDGISLIAVENGKTPAYSMVFCKVFSIVLNNNEKQTL